MDLLFLFARDLKAFAHIHNGSGGKPMNNTKNNQVSSARAENKDSRTCRKKSAIPKPEIKRWNKSDLVPSGFGISFNNGDHIFGFADLPFRVFGGDHVKVFVICLFSQPERAVQLL